MSANFNISFNNIKNIIVKMNNRLSDDNAIIIDTTQELILNDVKPFFAKCFMFYGDSAELVNTPSLSVTIGDTTITVNAFQAHEYDPFKYYLWIGFEYSSQYDDNRPYIRGVEGYRYFDTLSLNVSCSCGGLSDITSFYENDFGFIGIYSVDKNAIISIIQNNRYSLNKIGDYGDILDLFKFIKKIYKTHINMSEDNPLETIYINGIAVNGQGKPIANYIIEFETSNIKIQGYYNNVLDNDSEIDLNIPYYGLYHLDSLYINHNLKLKFICDLMTNNTLCNIYIDNVIIDVIELKTGYEIPLNDLNINETKQRIYSVYNEDCFIVLKQKRIANNRVNTIIENTTIENEKTNNNLSGFIRCEDVMFYNNNLTDYEKTLIVNLLKNGVHI